MTLLLLFLTGLIAGTVDAIAGGGGLISLPILLSLGIPPALSFGTNKLQSTLGTLVATQRYYRHGLISTGQIYEGVIFGLIGSIAGSLLSQALNPALLQHLVPILLAGIFLYSLFTPRLGDQEHLPRMSAHWFYFIFGCTLGFYDGFVGPGTGSLWVFVLTYFMGYNLIKATAYTKLLNLNSSIIATICFAIGGNIDYRIALCMALGQVIGGMVGSHLAIKRGSKIIRPLFICMVAITVLTLTYRTYLHSALFTRVTATYGIMPQILAGVSVFLALFMLYMRKYKRSTA